jgi:hypothetical protein
MQRAAATGDGSGVLVARAWVETGPAGRTVRARMIFEVVDERPVAGGNTAIVVVDSAQAVLAVVAAWLAKIVGAPGDDAPDAEAPVRAR